MHRIHSGFTVAAPIEEELCDSLKNLLREMNTGEVDRILSLDQSTTTLFVSASVLPAQDYLEGPLPGTKQALPCTLVFATTYCGPLADHLEDLVKTCRTELITIFSHCHPMLISNKMSDKEFIAYLKAHSYKSAFNSLYNCITKKDVDREKNLRNEIERYLDRAQELNALNNLSAVGIKALIQRHIKTQGPEYEWCHKPDRQNLIEFGVINRGPIVTILVLLLLLRLLWWRPRYLVHLLAITVVLYLLYHGVVKYISSEKNETAKRPSDEKLRLLAATQLHPVINEMTATGPLKRGRLRRYFYAAALRVINFFAPVFMKIPTVTTIRWLVIDKKKRLVFLSNYSNTTDFYVRDFLNGSTPKGVNFMFTNGQGFPDARMLRYGGITEDPEGYMHAVHTGQQVTDLWYAHEPNLTADIIRKNRKIRNGLFRKMNEKEANEWLKLL